MYTTNITVRWKYYSHHSLWTWYACMHMYTYIIQFQQNQVEQFCRRGNYLSILPSNPEDLSTLFTHLLYDDSKKIVFCYVPKNGCSNMKRLLLILNGILAPESAQQKRPAEEVLKEVCIVYMYIYCTCIWTICIAYSMIIHVPALAPEGLYYIASISIPSFPSVYTMYDHTHFSWGAEVIIVHPRGNVGAGLLLWLQFQIKWLLYCRWNHSRI